MALPTCCPSTEANPRPSNPVSSAAPGAREDVRAGEDFSAAVTAGRALGEKRGLGQEASHGRGLSEDGQPHLWKAALARWAPLQAGKPPCLARRACAPAQCGPAPHAPGAALLPGPHLLSSCRLLFPWGLGLVLSPSAHPGECQASPWPSHSCGPLRRGPGQLVLRRGLPASGPAPSLSAQPLCLRWPLWPWYPTGSQQSSPRPPGGRPSPPHGA